jgi:hypothetical protein
MSHAPHGTDKLLIKPTAGARPASPCMLGRFIRKARNNGLTPDESQDSTNDTGWQRPLTDRPTESHRPLSGRSEFAGASQPSGVPGRTNNAVPREATVAA